MGFNDQRNKNQTPNPLYSIPDQQGSALRSYSQSLERPSYAANLLAGEVDPMLGMSRNLLAPNDRDLSQTLPGMLSVENPLRTPVGFIGKLLDYAGRGNYASAAFFGSLIEGPDQNKPFLQTLSAAFDAAKNEFVDPKARLSFEDLIKRYSPEFAEENPTTTFLAGFAGDLVFDPLNYVGIGLLGKGKVIVAGGQRMVLSKAGGKALTKIIAGEGADFAKLFGKEAGNELVMKAVSRIDEMGKAISREGADRVIGELIQSASSAELKAFGLTKQKGLRVFIPGGEIPLYKATKPLGEAVEKVFDLTGVSALNRKLGVTEGLAKAAGIFSRNASLNKEYVAVRDFYINEIGSNSSYVIDDAKKLFSLGEKSLKKVDELAQTFDRELIAQASKTGSLDNAALDAVIQKAGLSVDEHAAFARITQSSKQIIELDGGLEMLKKQIMDFDPKTYQAFMKGATAGKEDYALYMLAQRSLLSRQSIAKKAFNDGLEAIFGTSNLAELPKTIAEDVRYVGDARYSQVPEAFKGALSIFDKYTTVFKTLATVAKPSFSAVQASGNFAQQVMTEGWKAVKLLDPRAVLDAAMLGVAKAGEYKVVPKFLADFAGEYAPMSLAGKAVALAADMPNAANMVVKSPFGHSYTGREVLDFTRKYGVSKGLDIRGEKAEEKVFSMVLAATRNNGAAALAKDALSWWKWPSKVEDFFRNALFVNGLRAGHSPSAAAQLTEKAFFNYSSGLSVTERQLFSRIIPFYSYQRFAIPLIAETAFSSPGRIAAIEKTKRNLLRWWEKQNTGEELNEAEREILDGHYILEQPSAFVGFDEQGKAKFNTFVNYTPLESLNLIDYDERGDFSFQGTLKKVLWGQVTPILKMSAELAVDRKFFTDQVIGKARKQGDIYKVLDQLPEEYKKAMAYELRTDPRSGKQYAYINPYIAYTVQNSFPMMTQIVRMGDENLSPTEKAQSILLGVQTKKIDLGKERLYKVKGLKADMAEAKAEMRKALRSGQTDLADRYREDMFKTLEQLKTTLAAPGEVRSGQ